MARTRESQLITDQTCPPDADRSFRGAAASTSGAGSALDEVLLMLLASKVKAQHVFGAAGL